MADAYKVKADTSFPEVIRTGVTVHGEEFHETVGNTYAEGDFVHASQLTPRDRERAENGELDHLLEPADQAEYEEWANATGVSIRIPEHEVERYIAINDGRTVVEKDQVLELRAAGEEAAKEYGEAQKEAGLDQRPQITEQKAFVEVSSISEDDPVLPQDTEPVSVAAIEEQGVEMPPGHPVGPTLAKAEGADPEAVDKDTEKADKKAARRSRPGSESGSAPSTEGSQG